MRFRGLSFPNTEQSGKADRASGSVRENNRTCTFTSCPLYLLLLLLLLLLAAFLEEGVGVCVASGQRPLFPTSGGMRDTRPVTGKIPRL